MDAHQILLHSDTQFLESLLPLFLDRLSPLQFLLPGLIQTLHQLFAGLHLFLKLGLGDGLDPAIFGLIGYYLLLSRYRRVKGAFAA